LQKANNQTIVSTLRREKPEIGHLHQTGNRPIEKGTTRDRRCRHIPDPEISRALRFFARCQEGRRAK
jgi:hypothetical protein